MIGSIGATEWLWIALFILLLLVGSKKLPELAKALGRSMGEFEKGRREIEKELREAKSPTQDSEREKLEKAAKDLGIQIEGKTTPQLKEEIARAVSS
jgi:sec-independent protein translocase protein TatA